jgi:IPT/TIG domain-containing protein/glycosyl hydrolase family 16
VQRFVSLGFGAIVAFSILGKATPSAYAVTNLVFDDEFNGASSNVNTANWNFDLGNSSSIAMGGWGNQEKQVYTSRTNNAYVANNMLHIIVLNDQSGTPSTPYSSARLQTLGKFSATYGLVQFRAKLPANGSYWWPACWMLATNYSGTTGVTNSWPECGEMDVMESQGQTPGDVLGTIHKDSNGNQGNDSPIGGQYNFPAGDGTTNFHTYVLSWGYITNSVVNQATISFGVDNNTPYENITQHWTSSIGPYPTPFNHPFYIIMNCAVGGTFFTNNPSVAMINAASTFPAEMDIQYVRVYQNVSALAVTGVSPTNGCQVGGTAITITGSNFFSGATVTVGGVLASNVVFVNTNKITAVVPPNPAGAMNVAVQLPYISPTGTNTDTFTTNLVTSTLTNAFTYTPGPSFGGLSSATPAVNAATLSWSAASGTAPITYNVYEATTSGGENYASPLLTTNGLSAFITPLSLGSNCSTTYYFVVRAVDGCGNTDGNTDEMSVQLVAPGPTFAGIASATAATEAATLSWSTASGSTPFTYNVYEATNSGGENLSSPSLTTNGLSTFVSLYPGSNSPITYFFIVRAQDVCGNIDSNTVELSVQPLLNPNKSQVGDGIPNGWKEQYGLNPFDPNLANEDPDGDGMNNLQEYLAGTDPTNSASFFHIISITPQGSDMFVTWECGGGRTNVLQANTDLVNGAYTNVSGNIILSGTGVTVTNYLDAGAATNASFLYYRIQLVP